MPTLRILADGRTTYATPGADDLHGVPAFRVAGGETVLVTLDFTAWLGAATLSVASWTVSGASITSEATSGANATALVAVPQVLSADPCWIGDARAITLQAIVAASDGRIWRRLVRLYAEPASVDSNVVLDVSTLG